MASTAAQLPDVSEERGACALCAEAKPLLRSHIIPNAVFRRIKQAQGSGQLIQLDDADETPVRRSQDTWPEYLLCRACEGIIGGYERYGLELLRGEGRLAKEHTGGMSFPAHDFRRFKLFLTSLLWRAAVSRQPPFSKVVLPPACCETARVSLLSGKPLTARRLGCRLRRLVDPTGVERGGFSADDLRQLVISPIPRLHGGSNHYSLLFVMEGFLLEFFVRAVPLRLAGQRGIHTDAPVLFVPNRNLFEVPDLVKLMVSAYAKQDPV